MTKDDPEHENFSQPDIFELGKPFHRAPFHFVPLLQHHCSSPPTTASSRWISRSISGAYIPEEHHHNCAVPIMISVCGFLRLGAVIRSSRDENLVHLCASDHGHDDGEQDDEDGGGDGHQGAAHWYQKQQKYRGQEDANRCED